MIFYECLQTKTARKKKGSDKCEGRSCIWASFDDILSLNVFLWFIEALTCYLYWFALAFRALEC